MEKIGLLVFLVVFVLVLIGIPLFFGIKIFKGFKRSGFEMRNVVLNGKRTTARIVNTHQDMSGRGMPRSVDYEYEAFGQTFRGSTMDRLLDKGDRLEIEYDPDKPESSFPAVMVEEARRKVPADLLAKLNDD